MSKINSILQNYTLYDPTNTLFLRNAFEKDMQKRFVELINVIKLSVNKQDCFGLKIQTNQMEPVGENRFMFLRSEEKLVQFRLWLEEQINKGILTITEIEQLGSSVEAYWTNKYILDSYKRGLIRARLELRKAGFQMPTIDETGGIELSMSTPFHLERIGLLYTRVFTDLQGITSAMDTQISRVLAQGLADGDGPALLARKLVASINGEGIGDLALRDTLGRVIPAQTRAMMLSRTEIIRAHHQAMIQEYMNWRLEKVFVMAEVFTAGDKRVCDKCVSLAKGGPYTLEQVMNLIPYHTQCRCVALPYIVNDKK